MSTYVGLALAGIVTAVAGAFGLVLWRVLARAGSRFVSALLEIARLPDVVSELVTELRNAIEELRGLARRVERLETFLPDSVRVSADLTLTATSQETP